jgi:methionyl aminopeptidase
MYNIYGDYIKKYLLRGVNDVINIPNYLPNENIIIESLNIGSTIHKKVRKYLYPYLKPGITLLEIAKLIESKTIELSQNHNTINHGIGFPSSLSLNNCAAHFHPEYKSTIAFNQNDVLKIDFGVEINGWITDCAFTVCFDEKYDNLLTAVREATYTGIQNAGIDVRIGEWSAKIQEVMESYEIILNGKTHQIKSISNLCGHNIVNGIIHGGMILPAVNMKGKIDENYKFKEGVYAIETFGSTGNNYAYEKGNSTLYRLNPKQEIVNLDQEVLNFYNNIDRQFKTLPFTDRYVQYYNSNYKDYLKTLKHNNLILSYPPLCVEPSSIIDTKVDVYTAQYEHTIYIDENKKIIFTNGDDY